MAKNCEELDVKRFEIVTSPEAKAFYIKIFIKNHVKIKGRDNFETWINKT